ncbi:hypothetical protein F4777DRAFT_537712 [Nemania sp. FL0916]|nr:hypothetical protein F4777DRAFT_537712 [Nemania sp. FL0916]
MANWKLFTVLLACAVAQAEIPGYPVPPEHYRSRHPHHHPNATSYSTGPTLSIPPIGGPSTETATATEVVSPFPIHKAHPHKPHHNSTMVTVTKTGHHHRPTPVQY